MNSKNFVILAAGQSKRLGEHFNKLPKCLIKIHEQELLLHQYSAIKELGNYNVYVVTGHRQDLVAQFIHEKKLDIKILYNSKFDMHNTMYSVKTAFDHIKQDLIVLDGDLVFESKILSQMVKASLDTIVITPHSFSGDECVIEFDKGLLMGFQKNSISAPNNPEYIGISFFLKKTIELMLSIDEKKNYSLPYEACLGHVIQEEGLNLQLLYAPRLLWSDLDTLEDYSRITEITKKIN